MNKSLMKKIVGVQVLKSFQKNRSGNKEHSMILKSALSGKIPKVVLIT